MRRFTPRRHFIRKGQSALTIIELLIVSALTGIVAVALMYLFVFIAREQRVGFVQQQVFEEADRLQDKITELLQGASRNAGIHLADLDGAFYHRIVFRTSVGSPNQELHFDTTAHTLTYDPDMSNSGDEVTLGISGGSSTIVRLDNVRFRSVLKTGGIPDGSVILVIIDVSDHGYARQTYRDPSAQANWIMNTRSFAVNLRQV